MLSEYIQSPFIEHLLCVPGNVPDAGDESDLFSGSPQSDRRHRLVSR